MSSDRVESTYDAASKTKGTARPRPKSAPPRGGPASITVATRACWAPAAAGSWRGRTTARKAPAEATLKNVEPVPSTKATAGICQNVTSSRTIVTTRLPIARTRTPSAAIISRFRFQRSAATPATGPKSAAGRIRANVTSPAFAGECVRARTRSG
jgi:hypothetical protein